MIKAVIIDDEQHCIDRLSYLIDNYCSDEIIVTGTASDTNDGFDVIKTLAPQLVFLDIQIQRQTGFDLLKKYISLPFDVIFTTAYEQYAIQAFKFSAVDYLLKPIDPDELKLTIKKLKEKMEREDNLQKFELLLNNLRHINQQDPKITVPTFTGLEFIRISDIIRCQSDVNYTTIFMKDKKTLMVAKTLKEFEGLLNDYNFFRLHNSHLVNLAYIKSYHKGKGGFVELEDKTELEVSTRRKDEFLVRLSSMK
ncbi:MAG TPA: LytTR family DNA-binding domain-containing protein [Mucilaginibacter sp.]|jgi:two-component system LytT family response regulator